MKKLFIAISLLLLAAIGICAFYSPLTRYGAVALYRGNDVDLQFDGFFYRLNDCARVDFDGTYEDMMNVINDFCDRVVKTETGADGCFVYAHSDRVKEIGLDYNVTGYYRNGKITVATPVLLGSA